MPAIAERLPDKYLVKEEAPKTISSHEQHQAYIQRLLDLQRKAPSNCGRNGNRQTACRLDRGLRSEAFHHRKGFGH